MRTRLPFMAVLVVAVIGASCSDGKTNKTSETTSTTAVTTTVPSTAQLEAMLLTADDINVTSAGWTVKPLNKEGLAASAQLPCEGVTLDPAVAKRLTADTGIDVSRADGNASLLELLVTGDAAQLSDDLSAYHKAFQSCLTTQSTNPDTSSKYRELALPKLGDQQWAFVGTPKGWPPNSRGYSAYVRVGTVAVALGVMEQPVKANAELQITDKDFVRLLETAVGKISG